MQEIQRELTDMIDPTHPNFMSVRIGKGQHSFEVSLGGPIRSHLRFLGQLTANDRPATDTTVAYLHGQGAPVAGLAKDIVTGEDFMGENVKVTTREGAMRLAMANLVPIAGQEIVEWHDYGNAYVATAAVAASGLGVNARRSSVSELRNEKARELLGPGATYED